MYLPSGYLTIYTLRDAIIPLVRSQSCPPRTNDLNRSPAMATAAKIKNKTKYPGLSSSRSDWRDIQRRCQPTPTQPTKNIYIHIWGGALGPNIPDARDSSSKEPPNHCLFRGLVHVSQSSVCLVTFPPVYVAHRVVHRVVCAGVAFPKSA